MTETTAAGTVTVRTDDLDMLVAACTSYLPSDVSPEVHEAFGRLLEGFDAAHGIEGEMPVEPEADTRPDGFWGRVEIAGYRDATGWVTEQTRFGLQMAVVSDWDGRVIDEFALGPNSRVEHLPTPLRKPEAQRAITSGWGEDRDEDDLGDDRDEPF